MGLRGATWLVEARGLLMQFKSFACESQDMKSDLELGKEWLLRGNKYSPR